MNAATIERVPHRDATERRTGSKIEAHRPADHLTTVEACERLGISYRQLNYWVTGWGPLLGIPEAQPGSGQPVWIPCARMPQLRTIARLRALGMELDVVMALDHGTRLRLLAVMRKALML